MYLYTMKTMLAILCIGTMFSCARRAENKVFEEKVILALEQQLERYPHSTVRDVYKNFFQDKFGPGHLLEDTSAAGRYLRRELASYDPDTLLVKGPYIDSTGWEHRFVRVDLRVIEEGKVSYEVFFEAFVRGVQAAPSVPLGSWTREWNRIVGIMEKQQYPLTTHPGYRADKDSIAANLRRGEFVGHHSREYVASYAPHYRLIAGSELHSLGL